MNDPMTVAHADREERARRDPDIDAMLMATPDHVPNNRGALVLWLVSLDKWSIPDIHALVGVVMEERNK